MHNGAPWWTPRSIWNHSSTSPAIKTAHWIPWYDSLMSRHILPLMPTLCNLICPAPWRSSITSGRLNHSFSRLSTILSSNLRNTEIRVIPRLQSLIVWSYPGLGIGLVKPFLNCMGMSSALTIAFRIHLRVSMHMSPAYSMCSTVFAYSC